MSEVLFQLIELARLNYQKGDLRKSFAQSQSALLQARELKLDDHWIEAARLTFQTAHELEVLNSIDTLFDEVVVFSKNTTEKKLQARAENILAMWLLAKNQSEQALALAESAIDKATALPDLETLARSLLTAAVIKSQHKANATFALQQLDKVDIVCEELQRPEISISSKLLRSYIYTQSGHFEVASELLWKGYEEAKIHGFHLIITSILAQLARIQRDQGREEHFRLYSELASRGINAEQTPRLYRLVSQLCPQNHSTLVRNYDLAVDERTRSVREREKGLIDFKSQHILYDMALLFIHNPGKRFSKEDLTETIWKQVYDPRLHDNLIYVSIKRLRSLLEPDLESPRYILRDRKGYYLNPQITVHLKNAEDATL